MHPSEHVFSTMSDDDDDDAMEALLAQEMEAAMAEEEEESGPCSGAVPDWWSNGKHSKPTLTVEEEAEEALWRRRQREKEKALEPGLGPRDEDERAPKRQHHDLEGTRPPASDAEGEALQADTDGDDVGFMWGMNIVTGESVGVERVEKTVQLRYGSYQGVQLSGAEMRRVKAEECAAMLRARKLVLVLDLDHTLLNSAPYNELDAESGAALSRWIETIGEPRSPQVSPSAPPAHPPHGDGALSLPPLPPAAAADAAAKSGGQSGGQNGGGAAGGDGGGGGGCGGGGGGGSHSSAAAETSEAGEAAAAEEEEELVYPDSEEEERAEERGAEVRSEAPRPVEKRDPLPCVTATCNRHRCGRRRPALSRRGTRCCTTWPISTCGRSFGRASSPSSRPSPRPSRSTSTRWAPRPTRREWST